MINQENPSARQEQTQQYLQSYVTLITLLTILLVFINAHFAFHWSYTIILGYLSILSILMLIQRFLKAKRLEPNCCFQVVEGCLITTYVISLIYNWEVHSINISYVAYGILIFEFGALAVLVFMSRSQMVIDNQQYTDKITDILTQAIKSVASLQLTFLSLKWMEQIEWGWLETFIIFWFTLTTIQLIEICLFIDLLNKVFQKTRSIQNNRIHIIGAIWSNIICFGLSTVPFSTLFACGLWLDKEIDIFIYTLLYTVIYYCIQVMVFMKNRQSIIQYCMANYIYYGDEIPQNPQLPITRIDKLKSGLKAMHQIAVKVPQYLYKISSTYYVDQTHIEPPSEDSSKKFDVLISSPRTHLKPNLIIEPTDVKQHRESCLVCYDKQPNVVYMPCGHGGFCDECAQELLRKSELCLLCRNKVTHTLLISELNSEQQIVKVIKAIE